MSWDAETVAQAFLEAYSAVYGTKPRHKCEALGRCVYDERCPLIEDCMPSEYAE